MKSLTIEGMELIEGGFQWGNFTAGVGFGVGILSATTV